MYGEYIAEQIAREDDRRKSFEARGVTVVTSSGTLAALLVGLVAIATREDFQLPESARLPLSLALVAFGVAAVAAILTNMPVRYPMPDEAGLGRLVTESWNDAEDEAVQAVSANRLNGFAKTKKINGFKGWTLVVALFAESVAIGFLAWAMIEIL